MEKPIMVSVLCAAYNHEKYIRQCLDGFIMQKTTFPFEVLVHDDASTDHTADIIREYEAKYPDIIKTVYQTENQYSQHIPITKTFLLPKARGKYLAFCEGDDFWTDPLKLQKQVDALEAHPECKMAVCRVEIVEEDGSKTGEFFPSEKMQSGVLNSDRFLEIVAESGFQTSGKIVDRDQHLKYILEPPIYKQVADVGDAPQVLYFGSVGPIYYNSENMSCYRRNSAGSWTVRIHKDNEKQIKHYEHMLQMVAEFDKYTNYKYHDICERMRENYIWPYLYLKRDFRAFFEEIRQEGYRRKTFRRKMHIWAFMLFPHIVPKLARWYHGGKAKKW